MPIFTRKRPVKRVRYPAKAFHLINMTLLVLKDGLELESYYSYPGMEWIPSREPLDGMSEVSFGKLSFYGHSSAVPEKLPAKYDIRIIFRMTDPSAGGPWAQTIWDHALYLWWRCPEIGPEIHKAAYHVTHRPEHPFGRVDLLLSDSYLFYNRSLPPNPIAFKE